MIFVIDAPAAGSRGARASQSAWQWHTPQAPRSAGATARRSPHHPSSPTPCPTANRLLSPTRAANVYAISTTTILPIDHRPRTTDYRPRHGTTDHAHAAVASPLLLLLKVLARAAIAHRTAYWAVEGDDDWREEACSRAQRVALGRWVRSRKSQWTTCDRGTHTPKRHPAASARESGALMCCTICRWRRCHRHLPYHRQRLRSRESWT